MTLSSQMVAFKNINFKNLKKIEEIENENLKKIVYEDNQIILEKKQ